MFLHGGWLHLLGNMLFLWIFANRVEDRMGRIVFPIFYLVGGIAAGMTPRAGGPDLRRSGRRRVRGDLGGDGRLCRALPAGPDPVARVPGLLLPADRRAVGDRARVLVRLQLIDGFASLGAATEAGGGVALFAHIGGFVAGAALALPFRYIGRLRPAPRSCRRPRCGSPGVLPRRPSRWPHLRRLTRAPATARARPLRTGRRPPTAERRPAPETPARVG